MDLALELGMPLQALKLTMTERELGMWRLYAVKKLLPARRLELYLAQVARAVGGGALQDYLLRPAEEARAEETVIAVQTIAPGAGMRRLGQGRNRKAH